MQYKFLLLSIIINTSFINCGDDFLQYNDAEKTLSACCIDLKKDINYTISAKTNDDTETLNTCCIDLKKDIDYTKPIKANAEELINTYYKRKKLNFFREELGIIVIYATLPNMPSTKKILRKSKEEILPELKDNRCVINEVIDITTTYINQHANIKQRFIAVQILAELQKKLARIDKINECSSQQS